MPRQKTSVAENLEVSVPQKARTPKRYKISKACYVDNTYHEAGDIIVLSNESLKAWYMEEV